MKKQESNTSFWQAKWRRVLAGFLGGASAFIAIVLVLWVASYYMRFIVPFDQLFQSQAILKIPEVMIPLVFYDVLALPPVMILALVLSWFLGRNLWQEKGLHLSLSILIGLASIPLGFLIVSIGGMVLSGSAADASAFALLAPLPPAFILGYLPGWKLGRSIYTQLTLHLDH